MKGGSRVYACVRVCVGRRLTLSTYPSYTPHPTPEPPPPGRPNQGLACRWIVKCDDDVYADGPGLVKAIDALAAAAAAAATTTTVVRPAGRQAGAKGGAPRPPKLTHMPFSFPFP